MSIEDVTERVNAAVKPDMSPADAQKARRAVMNTIEKESLDKTGLRSDVVTLYQGGQVSPVPLQEVHRRAAGVRAGEGDRVFRRRPGQFRVPAVRPRHLLLPRLRERQAGQDRALICAWSKAGADENELVFVAGHPGRTDRLNTVAHLEFMRDRVFPSTLNTLRRREVLLENLQRRSLENARRAEDELFGFQNSRKARLGGLAGLQDPSDHGAKATRRKGVSRSSGQEPEAQGQRPRPGTTSNSAMLVWDEMYVDHGLFERGAAFNTTLFGIARDLVRLAEESEQAKRRSAARVSRDRTSNRSSRSCSPKRRFTRTWRR